MDSTETSIKQIQFEFKALEQYLKSPAPDAWASDSECGLWKMRDVVTHLVWVAEFYLDTISRGVNGDASAPEDRPPGDAVNARSFDAYLSERASSRQENLGDQLLPSFSERYKQLNQLMAGLE